MSMVYYTLGNDYSTNNRATVYTTNQLASDGKFDVREFPEFGVGYAAFNSDVGNGPVFYQSFNSRTSDLSYTNAGYFFDFADNIDRVSIIGGNRGDVLQTGTGNDTLNGRAGNDTLNGGAGIDTMQGGLGNDRYVVGEAGDQVIEAAGGGTDTVFVRASYVLSAGQEVEVLATTRAIGGRSLDLTGNETVQTLYGNNGANVLDGKGGSDQLVGKGGADTFACSTVLGTGNVDRIVDFAGVDDTIQLNRSVFTALGAGPLSAGAFKDLSGPGASVDADDRILYDDKGRLFYDADGVGGSDAVLFAKLSYKPDLSFGDFLIV